MRIRLLELKNRKVLILPSILGSLVLFIVVVPIFGNLFGILLFLVLVIILNHWIARSRFVIVGELLFEDENIRLSYGDGSHQEIVSNAEVHFWLRKPTLTQYLGSIGSFIRYSSLRFTNYDDERFDYLEVKNKRIHLKITSMKSQRFLLKNAINIHFNSFLFKDSS